MQSINSEKVVLEDEPQQSETVRTEHSPQQSTSEESVVNIKSEQQELSPIVQNKVADVTSSPSLSSDSGHCSRTSPDISSLPASTNGMTKCQLLSFATTFAKLIQYL